MSLAPREQRALARIEHALRISDPRLAARLATFTALTSRGRVPRWKWLSPWRLRLRRLVPLALPAAAVTLGLVLGHFIQPSGRYRMICGVVTGHMNICQVTSPSRHPAPAPGRSGSATRPAIVAGSQR
jgi:Protein of unknown function (DUF3040)